MQPLMPCSPVDLQTRDAATAVAMRMAELAHGGGSPDIARALARTAAMLVNDPLEAVREVEAMFGGMGSLNDVVLYAGGRPLAAENREFDALRTELFDLVLALR